MMFHCSECYRLNDEGLCAVVKAYPNLKSFSLVWNEHITSLFTETLSNSCTQLSALSLSKCSKMNDDMVAHIGQLSLLKKLHIKDTEKVTNQGLKKMLLGCSAVLEELNLEGCREITDDGLAAIADCNQLRSLTLNLLPEITDEVHFFAFCPF